MWRRRRRKRRKRRIVVVGQRAVHTRSVS